VIRESGFMLGPWHVQPTLRLITGPDGTVHLEPKVMDVLVLLAERAGQVVTREQFVERVWHDRIVSDEVLSRCISLLRTQLHDNPREPRFIQTVSKLGYRLVMPVEPVAASAHGETETTRAAAPMETPQIPRLRRALTYAGIAVLAIAVIFGLTRLIDRNPSGAAREQAAIVVLPFANISNEPDNQYFSDGLTEELIDRLARIPGLRVVARTSAFSFKDGRQDVREIARTLGVGYVLEGSVRKEGDRVRITAQLVDAGQGFHIWSEQFDGELGQIFAVQDEIAQSIVAKLGPRLAGSNTGPNLASAPPTRVIAAYELLLRGRYHLKQRDEAPIRRAIELFEQALERDPRFADAYCELARAYALLPYYSYEDQDEMFEQAIATLKRGVAANPAVGAASQDTLAFISFGRWQWIEAEERFRSALARQPDDPNLQQWYSQQLAAVGQAARSLEHAQLAHRLDVLSPVVNDRLAVAYLWTNQDDEARKQFDVARELGMGPSANPDAYLVLLLRERDYAPARDIMEGLQKIFARPRDWIDPFLAALADPGQRPAAVAAVERAVRNRAISLKYQFGAWVYLGESERAIDVAFQLLEDRPELRVEFLFSREASALRTHPRFGSLIEAIGLAPYWDRYGWPPLCARKDKTIECH
jgi:TolB-like protein/DNA-binding winged helix-turn-helix (wHTH) protein/tetratricopeptide (TPR) repeat protein